MIFLLRTVWLLLLAGFFASVTGAEVTEGPRVQTGGTTAKIWWKTDVACGSKVRIGTSAAQLTRKVDAEGVNAEHVVEVDGLQPGVTYFFSVGTSRAVLATGSFVAGGKTNPASAGEAAPKKSAPSSAKAPPTKKIWGNLASLPDHFARHGGDFHAASADDYARMSWEFL